MVNSSIPYVPNLNEIVALASLLDEMGYEKEAVILDNYLGEEYKRVTSSEKYTLVKRAGFWDDVWDKIKGRVGKAVFKDFREAYENAQEVQEKVKEKVDELNAVYKDIFHAIKTYQIGDWYKKLSNFSEIHGEELLNDSKFVDSYSKYRDRVIFKEKEKEETEVDKIYGPKEDEVEGDGPSEIGEWNAIFDKKHQGVQVHYQDDIVRIRTELWNRWLKGGHFKRVPDPTGKGDITVMFNATAKGRIPENLQAALGEGIWKIAMTGKNDYVYLAKIETQKDVSESAPVEEGVSESAPVEEEDVFMKTPPIPSEPFKESPYAKYSQDGKVWVRSKANFENISLIPLQQVDETKHLVFTNRRDIDRLNVLKNKKEEQKEEQKEASSKNRLQRLARIEKLLKISEA